MVEKKEPCSGQKLSYVVLGKGSFPDLRQLRSWKSTQQHRNGVPQLQEDDSGGKDLRERQVERGRAGHDLHPVQRSLQEDPV